MQSNGSPRLAIHGLAFALVLSCSKERTARKTLDASGEVYVLLTLESLAQGGPSSPDDAKHTTWEGFEPSFAYRDVTVDGRNLRAVVAYTAPPLIPDRSVFMTVTPNQAMSYVRADPEAQAFVVNPDTPASYGVVTRDRFADFAGALTQRRPLPMSISVTR